MKTNNSTKTKLVTLAHSTKHKITTSNKLKFESKRIVPNKLFEKTLLVSPSLLPLKKILEGLCFYSYI